MKPIRFVALVLALSTFLGASCQVHSVSVTGGVTASPGQIVATIGVVIQMAQAADPAVQAVADGSSVLTAAQKAQFDAASHDAAASLALIQTALANYTATASAPAACQLRTALDQAVGDRLQVIALLQDFGLAVPPQVAVIVGAIGSVIDIALPSCPPDGGIVLAAHAPSETARIRAVLDRPHAPAAH